MKDARGDGCGGYAALFEAASDGMVLADEGGSILDANPSARRLLGREDPIGSPFDALFDPIDVRLEPARRELREAGGFDGQLLVRRDDGTCFTAEVALRWIGDGRISAVFRSPGERERLNGSSGGDSLDGEARFRALVHGSPDLVALVGEDGTVGYISPSVERLHGFRPDEVEGRNLLELVHPEDRAAAAKDLYWTAANPGTVGLPGPAVRVAHRNGSWRYLEAFVSNHLEDPNVSALLFNCRDVTDRVRLEEELRASEARFRALVENAHDFVVLADENNVALYASPSIERILGYTPEEFEGTVIATYLHPDDLEGALRTVAETVPVPGPQDLGVNRYRRKDGSWCYLETVINNRIDDPVLGGVVCNCRDVTERVETEERLKESERWFRTLIQNAPDMIFVLEEDGAVRYASPSVRRLLGYDLEEELVGLKAQAYIHPDDLEEAERAVTATDGDPEAVGVPGPLVRIRHKDGSWRIIEGSLTNLLDDPNVRGLVFNSRDVTEQVEAEEALKASEERFRALVENAQDFVVLADENNVALYASPAIERVMGYTPEEFVGTVIASYAHPDDLRPAGENVSGTLPTPGPHLLNTVRYRRKDGSYRYLEVVVNNRLDEPALRGVVCNCRDVTERVEAEMALRESEERHRALNENALDFVVVQKADNKLSYVSPSIERLLGWTPEEAVGKLGAEFIHPEDLEWAWPTFYRMLQTPGINEGVTIRYRHKDGSWRWFESNCTNQLDNPAVEGLVFNCRDVTERVESEERLRESEGWHRALNEHAADLIVVQNADATVSYVSPSVERILGYSPEEFVAVGVPAIIHPEDLGRAWDALGEVVENPGLIRSRTLRYRHADGSWRALETVCNSRVDDPDVHGLVFNCRDVTERVEAEEEIRRLNVDLEKRVEERTAQLRAVAEEAESNAGMLRESEERFRLLAEGTVEGISLSENGTVFDANDNFLRMFGYGREEAAGMGAVDFLAPEDRPAVARRIFSGDAGAYEARGLKKDGAVFPVEIRPNVLPYHGRDVRVASIFDLSERKEAEEALKASEELYRTVIEQAAENVFLADPETKRILEANTAFRRSLGYTARQMEHVTLYDVVDLDPESLDASVRRIRGGQRFAGERRYRREDGSLIDVEVTASAIPYRGGEALCIVAHDVTERKRSEASLRRSLDSLLALHEAGRILGSTLELEKVGPRLLEVMQRVSSLAAAVVHVRDEDRKWHVWHTIGPEELWRTARRTPEAIAARWMALQTEEHRPFRLRGRDGDGEVSAGLCLPLRVRDKAIGVLEVYGPETLVEEDTTEILRSLAAQAASALENARLYRELTQREQRLQELVGKILVAQEEERRRVAYEVHDGLAQVAAATHQHLQAYARRYPAGSKEGARDMDHILKLVRQTVSDARLVIANLRPTVLDDLGLAAALSLKVAELRDDGWRIEYEESLGKERLPVPIETAFFRVAQEALTNARKHAGTRRARVALRRSPPDRLVLEVQDWGRGFDTSASMGEGGPGERVGLSGMQERVGMLGGDLEVRSRPGEGTMVLAEAPLPAPTEEDGRGS